MTLKDRIINLLTTDKPKTAKSIAYTLGETSTSVSSVLSVLHTQGWLTRTVVNRPGLRGVEYQYCKKTALPDTPQKRKYKKRKTGSDEAILADLLTAIQAAAPVLKKYSKLAKAMDSL